MKSETKKSLGVLLVSCILVAVVVFLGIFFISGDSGDVGLKHSYTSYNNKVETEQLYNSIQKAHAEYIRLEKPNSSEPRLDILVTSLKKLDVMAGDMVRYVNASNGDKKLGKTLDKQINELHTNRSKIIDTMDVFYTDMRNNRIGIDVGYDNAFLLTRQYVTNYADTLSDIVLYITNGVYGGKNTIKMTLYRLLVSSVSVTHQDVTDDGGYNADIFAGMTSLNAKIVVDSYGVIVLNKQSTDIQCINVVLSIAKIADLKAYAGNFVSHMQNVVTEINDKTTAEQNATFYLAILFGGF